jgi:hypothetical protein
MLGSGLKMVAVTKVIEFKQRLHSEIDRAYIMHKVNVDDMVSEIHVKINKETERLINRIERI